MSQLLLSLPPEAHAKLHARTMPEWIDPMLAKLTTDYFSDPDWIFERKLDGERCIAYVRPDGVRLRSRSRQELNVQYPELVTALMDAASTEMILDGEVVAFDGETTSFARLQQRMHLSTAADVAASDVPVVYYLFDLLYLDGYDTGDLTQRQRKALLKELIRYHDPLRYLSHRDEKGIAIYHEACRDGWEGIIAKDGRAPYVHGRSNRWLKFKCVNQQEFVVGGYTSPQGRRIAFGALLIGYYEDGALHYAGKVGTGYDEDTLRELGQRLESLRQDRSPFAGDDAPRDAHWVAPKLVAEVGFSEWTSYGKLRHPRYLGLRPDKAPEDVVREEPSPAPADA